MHHRKHPGESEEPGEPTAQRTLLEVLLTTYPESNRTRAQQWIREGRVRLDGSIAVDPRTPVMAGMKVTLGPRSPSEAGHAPLKGRPTKGVQILYQDRDLLVIDKAAGLLSVPAPGTKKEHTAYGILEKAVGHPLYIVHRLDRETSGVMLFAQTAVARDTLQEEWNETVEDRLYVALIEGEPREKTARLVSFLKENAAKKIYAVPPGTEGSKQAILEYRVLRGGPLSLVEIRLHTGRKNQIRAQFEELGHPVAGDKKYGARTNPIGRLALHAKSIRFRHPDGRVLEFESPPPSSFKVR